MEEVSAQLRGLDASFAFGKVVHEGLTLAIVGRPNVGKSSLFNRLVERERAIVTALPGTTRDLVTETVALGGIPVRLVDTAGIREAHGLKPNTSAFVNPWRRWRMPTWCWWCWTPAHELNAVDRELLADVAGRAAIVVRNKADLGARGEELLPPTISGASDLSLTGEGIAELRAEILRTVRGSASEDGGAMLTNLRQQAQVRSALGALTAAASSVQNGRSSRDGAAGSLQRASRPG